MTVFASRWIARVLVLLATAAAHADGVDPPMVIVPGTDAQPSGPAYAFRLGAFEITTDEFAFFLNDALVALADFRGQYLYHDLDSSSVYLNSVPIGMIGTNGTGTLVYSRVQGGRIHYDPPAAAYVVDAGWTDRPAVGVTWYGAAKFCNWLTLHRGLGAGERAYVEGPGPADWRPATISAAAWASRDLTASERQALLALAGYRLPMDEHSREASPYNEWDKAAAWLTTWAVDAHGHGGLDSPGDIWEWVQDQSFSPNNRRIRGANWADAGVALPAITAAADSPDMARNSTGFRVVQALATALTLSPSADIVTAGRRGGRYSPAGQYVLANRTTAGIQYEAAAEADWVRIGGAETAAGWLAAGERVVLEVAISAGDQLAQGVNVTTIGFANVTAGSVQKRLLWLTLVEPPMQPPAEILPADELADSRPVEPDTIRGLAPRDDPEEFLPAMSLVPGTDDQPSGPTHDFQIGQGEVTNADFVRFLNSALQHPQDMMGQYLYHDVDSGSVYLNTSAEGVTGTNGFVGSNGMAAVVFDAAAGGRISFTDPEYAVQPGFEDHPVVGVSWIGAAKFCNWLTLAWGMDPSRRAYDEGPSPADWQPVAPPADLVALCNGYRLPMDGGAGAAAAYNEWYKAAAWQPVAQKNAVFAFGRDQLTNADANFLTSGDPFDNGTAPIGFFDGVHLLANGTTRTNANANAYDLYDLTGNAAEWAHDRFTAGDAESRAVRGGSWRSPQAASALRADGRSADTVGAARDYLGFRLAQSVIGDPLVVSPADNIAVSGVEGGPLEVVTGDGFLPPDGLVYVIGLEDQQSGTPRRFGVTRDADWIDLGTNAAVSGVIGPVTPTDEVAVQLNAGAWDLTSLVPVAGASLSAVSVASLQPTGPVYSFRIGTHEVTNAEFVAFVEDARVNLSNARGQYLYHDVDSGDVFLYSAATGVVGTNGTGVPLYSRSAGGRVLFDAASNGYCVEAGFDNHPVVGVSWYGAVKFCNWLTVHDGLGTGQRAYTEGPHPGDWHPVTISTAAWWGTTDTAGHPQPLANARDLDLDERYALVADYRGYRLPMDGGAVTAAPYNEWYEAAAWQPAAASDSAYGFGRETISPQDANYANSNGATPVGFYDGVNVLPEGPATHANSNAFHLFDLSGNVGEWVQDRTVDSNGVDVGSNGRRVRGGSFADLADGVRTDAVVLLDPGAVDQFTGFRVAQAGLDRVATVTFADELLGDEFPRTIRVYLDPSLVWTPATGFVSSAAWGSPFSPASWATLLTNRSERGVNFTIGSNCTWLDIDGQAGLSGQIAAQGSRSVPLALNAAAAALPPGDHVATVTLTNSWTGRTESRTVTLHVADIVKVMPEKKFSFPAVYWGSLPGGHSTVFTVSNLAGFSVSYTASSTAGWLAVTGDASTTGVLAPAPDARILTVALTNASSNLAVGQYAAKFRVANTTAGSVLDRDVQLTILDPLEIAPSSGLASAGNYGGPFDPSSKTYTLTNHGTIPIDWNASVTAAWLEVNGGTAASGVLSPGANTPLTVAINSQALGLYEGVYTDTVSIQDLTTSVSQTRSVTLTVDEFLAVAPLDGFALSGLSSGPFLPSRKLYTLTNRDSVPLEWRVEAPGVDWIKANGGSAAAGTLGVGQSATVVVSVDQAALAAAGLAVGQHSFDVDFLNVTSGVGTTIRPVQLTIVEPISDVEMIGVPGAVIQPGGPTYSFDISQYEITNAEFAKFLNDSYDPAHRGDQRGQYLYHDVDSGDVYINSAVTGAAGTAGAGTLIFSAAVGGAVHFDATSNAYLVEAGREAHPVVGVSWFGAVKYCNWLTLDLGLPPEQCCYSEGPASDLDQWRPATIAKAAWATRDLTDAERQSLVAQYAGWRLPMDDGRNNANPAADAADNYNEWYKAAAWNVRLNRNVVYGFGRDSVGGADANYRNSGDPFDNGTTPVGYYDGTNHGGVFSTNANSNSFGVFDLSGNVMEWVQDKYSTASNRALRGGAYLSTSTQTPWIETTGRRVSAPGVATNALIGLRVVRVPSAQVRDGDGDADGDVDLADYEAFEACLHGPGAASLAPSCESFDFDADADVDLADYAAFSAVFGRP